MEREQQIIQELKTILKSRYPSKNEQKDRILDLWPKMPKSVPGDLVAKAFEIVFTVPGKRDINRSSWVHYDIADYIKAVCLLLPYLREEDVLFLWQRAKNEISQDDDERQWFGEIALGNIAPYLPKEKTESLLSEIDIESMRQNQAKCILLLLLADCYTGDDRVKLQLRAWERAALDYDLPIRNYSDLHASTLQWGNSRGSSIEELWIDSILHKFDPAIGYMIWKEKLEVAKSGRIELGRNDSFIGPLVPLSKVLPAIKALEACYECYDFYVAAGRREQVYQMLNILLDKIPPSNREEYTRKVIDYGLNYKPMHGDPFYTAEDLAKYLQKEK